MMRARIEREDGFTLSELIVVSALMGVILAAAWAAMSVASGSAGLADREGTISREIAAPLLESERLLIQQVAIQNATLGTRIVKPAPNEIAIDTDRDRDGNAETTVIEVTPEGEFVMTTRETNEHDWERVVWSTFNANHKTGTPLFTYFDGFGDEIDPTDVNVDVYKDAKSIKIELVIEYDDHQYTGSRLVTFRN